MTAEGEGIIVIGGGGHAKVVIDTLRLRKWNVVGFCDPNPDIPSIGGVPWLGDDTKLDSIRSNDIRHAIVALGSNSVRRKVATNVRSVGFRLANAIHPAAVVAGDVRLGEGIAIMAGAVINAASTIGDGAIVNTSASVDHDCSIGAYVHVAPGCHLCGTVSVEDEALLGVGSIVGRGRPLRVGRGAIVGAGAVVLEEVAAGDMVFGNPARGRVKEG